MSIAELESIQINLNSRYATRYIANNKSYCVFNLNNIVVPNQHHIHLSVVNCSIPYSFYNINSSNNFLMYTVQGVSSNVIISPGNYNAIQLCASLTLLMTGFSVKYNNITNKITFTNMSEFSINKLSTCLEMMGLVNLNSNSGSLTSTNCVNLQTIESICVHSDLTTGNFNSNNVGIQDILCNIVINSNPNSMIVYENQGSKFNINLYDNVLNQIIIKICDGNGILLDLNGCYFNITIQLDVIDFVN